MKLYIFGASGSGVTTLGRALATQMNVPYFDSDEYFWEESDPPFTVRRDSAKRNALIRIELEAHDHWILGGSVVDWGDHVFPTFDFIVFLWVPPEIRMARLRKREFERYGDIIISDPNRSRLFENFMRWAADYDNDTGIANRTLRLHENWLKKMTCPILELRGDLSTNERIKATMQHIFTTGTILST